MSQLGKEGTSPSVTDHLGSGCTWTVGAAPLSVQRCLIFHRISALSTVVPFVIAITGGCLNPWTFSLFSSAPVSMGCVLVVNGLSSGFGSLHTPHTAAGHSQLAR